MSGLSDAFVFSAKPRAVTAMKYRHNLPPINGRTFSPGDTIQLSIPCGNKGEFLNTKQSYLKFSLKNTEATTTDTLTLDYSASAVICLLEVNDVELCCEIVKLDGSVASAISQANASGYRIPMTTFSNHASSVESGSTLINTLISGNYRSLKTLFTIFRLQENMGDGTKKTDLETQSHKSAVSESGVDVSTSTIYLKAQFAVALAKALRIDTFTHQDAILFIDPSGMAQTVF
eukprot:jgi/Tetstr1/437772/TSEL_026426.t1